MDPHRPAPRIASFLAAFLLGAPVNGQEAAAPAVPAAQAELVGPGPVQADIFHPDRDSPITPKYGGRAIVHVASLPPHMNYLTDNSGTARRMLYPTHETLLVEDWENHDFRPRLCHGMKIEDLIVLRQARSEDDALVLSERYPMAREVRVANPSQEEGATRLVTVLGIYGSVREAPGGYQVSPLSKENPASGTFTVQAPDVDRVERGTVMSFDLRKDVRWHPVGDGPADHFMDADDVRFSWEVYGNPAVNCDESRYQFAGVTECEVVDSHYVRFFYEAQYAFALRALGTNLTILPSHVYNLADPDNADFAERFTQGQQGEFINNHPNNRMWIGLGPYRITSWSDQYIEAERFTDAQGKALYFDRDKAGYLDTIRWRVIANDATAMNALLNGELDYFARISPEDYFGGQTDTDLFRESFYKGYKYLGAYAYVGWNMFRPQLKEKAVRDALEMAIDMEAYLQTGYKGLANRVTGPFPYNSEAYDHSVKPRPYDPDGAMDLLDDANWYDRNGNGIRDKNGVELELSLLYNAGNTRSKSFGLAMQEAFAEIEVRLTLEQLEWGTFRDTIKKRDFDCCALAWLPELESDPEQIWHSRWGAPEVESSNHAGVQDAELDALIESGQRELNPGKRMKIWHALHRRIYEDINPYIFMYQPAYKVGVSKKLRGVQFVAIDPGYVLRRWYRTDATRTTLDR